MSFEEIYLIPALTTFGNFSSTLSLSYGYIKLFKSEIENMFKNQPTLTFESGLKTVTLLNLPILNNLDIYDSINSYLDNPGLSVDSLHKTIYNYMIRSIISLEWTDSFILNKKEQNIYNIAQAMIN